VGATGPQGPAGADAIACAAILSTASNGKVTWNFPITFAAPPAVTAAVVDPNTGDTTWFDVVIESVSTTQAVVQVLQTSAIVILAIQVLTAKLPAGAGRVVHLHAAKV
jgi:hypothetical protein